MNIAFIVNEFPAISETFILNQVTGLLDAGHNVRIFALDGKQRCGIMHPEIERYRLLERTHYFVPLPRFRLMRIMKALGFALRYGYRYPRMVAAALNVVRRGNIGMIYKLVPFLGKRFDIIHCHFGPNGVLGVALRELGVSGKIITSFHGYDANNYPLTAGRDVYDRLFAGGDYFTANTQFTKRQMEQLGCPADKIGILHEGLDVKKFVFSEKEAEAGEPVRLLTIGRLVEKKGHVFALRAVAALLKRHSNIKYIIAGEGPLRAELEQEIDMLKIRPFVVLCGSINAERARQLYAESHIFVLPSITTAQQDREGQALVLQEAQACGLPVVSTLHNGIPEGVLDGRSGFLVPEKDSSALAERLEYLIGHPEVWKSMGREGRCFVEKTFDSALLNKKLLAAYEMFVSKGRPI